MIQSDSTSSALVTVVGPQQQTAEAGWLWRGAEGAGTSTHKQESHRQQDPKTMVSFTNSDLQ